VARGAAASGTYTALGGGSAPGPPELVWWSHPSLEVGAIDPLVAHQRLDSGDNRALVSVRVKPPGGRWTVIGTGPDGIVPESVNLSVDSSGPSEASFVLRIDPSRAVSLAPFTPVVVEIGGVPVWGGRIIEAPGREGGDPSLNVRARGWQYALDDDLIQDVWVVSRLADYADPRSLLTTNLTVHKSGPVVQTGGAITLIYPNLYPVVNNEFITVSLDLGVSAGRRAVVAWERIGGSDSGLTLYSRASDYPDPQAPGDDGTAVLTASSGTISHTFTAGRRYHHLILYRNGGSFTYAADEGVRITSAKVFGSAAWESGGFSILRASDVIADVLASGALPLLSDSTAGITQSPLIDGGIRGIPHYETDGQVTPRQVLEAMNTFHNWRMGVDWEGRVIFGPRPTRPILETGSWSGSDFENASSGSGEDLYNKVIIEGTGPDSTPISTTVLRSDIASALHEIPSVVSNPGFETNTSGWMADLGSIARVTGSDGGGNVFYAGSAAAKLTASGDGIALVHTSLSNIIAGQTYVLRFAWRAVGASWSGHLNVYGYVADSLGATLGQYAEHSPSIPYVSASISFVAGADTALTFSALVTQDSGAVDTLYIDDVHVYAAVAGPLDRAGFSRAAKFSVGSVLTEAAAGYIGAAWLSDHSTTALRGSISVNAPGGARRAPGGMPLHPAHLLLYWGERIRLTGLADPDTGAVGRSASIASVSYSHDDGTATVSLDNPRDRLERLMASLAVISGG
jgi:hypothetical protein